MTNQEKIKHVDLLGSSRKPTERMRTFGSYINGLTLFAQRHPDNLINLNDRRVFLKRSNLLVGAGKRRVMQPAVELRVVGPPDESLGVVSYYNAKNTPLFMKDQSGLYFAVTGADEKGFSMQASTEAFVSDGVILADERFQRAVDLATLCVRRLGIGPNG